MAEAAPVPRPVTPTDPWLLLSEPLTRVRCYRYNFFLAMPIICIGLFDRDVSAQSVLAWKWVYISGLRQMDLNLQLMGQWLLQAS
jgi:hypothetical protein